MLAERGASALTRASPFVVPVIFLNLLFVELAVWRNHDVYIPLLVLPFINARERCISSTAIGL